jgi:DNA topoisomerase III
VFERVLQKLLVHRGAASDFERDEAGELEDLIRRGHPGWKVPYMAQRDHKRSELELMARFAEGHGCRMVALVRHFGDQEDSGAACGMCDACAPGKCYVRKFRTATAVEQRAMQEILDAIGERDSYAVGRLFRDHFEGTALDRDGFEDLLGALVRAHLVVLEQDEFEKDGETIRYERASLGPRAGLSGTSLASVEIDLADKRSERKRSRGSSKSGTGGARRAPPPWVRRAAPGGSGAPRARAASGKK